MTLVGQSCRGWLATLSTPPRSAPAKVQAHRKERGPREQNIDIARYDKCLFLTVPSTFQLLLRRTQLTLTPSCVFLFSVLRFNTIPLYGCFILSVGTGILVALFAYFFLVPHLRKKIDKEFETETLDLELSDDTSIQKGMDGFKPRTEEQFFLERFSLTSFYCVRLKIDKFSWTRSLV